MPENEAPTDDLNLITMAAQQAGRIAMDYFRSDPQVWYKGGTSPVSEADIAVDRYLQGLLRNARPDYGWLSEETEDDQSRLDESSVFVVDPIDGTRAFIQGENGWCVSVAVVHDGRSVAGVLACPARDEVFTAEIDAPSRKNGAVIKVAKPGTNPRIAAPKSVMGKIPEGALKNLERVPHISSLAYRLAMVADGRLAATFVKPNASDWDLAAADLILRQAGGRLTDIHGDPLRYNRGETTHGILIAAPSELLPTLRDAVADIDF